LWEKIEVERDDPVLAIYLGISLSFCINPYYYLLWDKEDSVSPGLFNPIPDLHQPYQLIHHYFRPVLGWDNLPLLAHPKAIKERL
jgi:hypothetical protein